MRNLFFSIICFLTVTGYAQDTVKKNNSIGNFTERFMVLKADKGIRHGWYKLYENNKMVASGGYDHGKRIGVWSFYTNGLEIQRYDYTMGKILNSFPDPATVTYNIPDIGAGDSVVTPLKIGGYSAAFRLMKQYTNYFKTISADAGNLSIDHLITLDENGKILSWMLRTKNNNLVKIKRLSLTEMPEETTLFLPAYVNGKKTGSTVIVHEQLTAMMGYTTTEVRTETIKVGTARTEGSGATTRTTIVTGIHP